MTPAEPDAPGAGVLLAEARKRLGWTLRMAGRASGVPNAHISQIETGTITKPGAETLAELAKAYGLPLSHLAQAAGHDGGWEAAIRADERRRIAAAARRMGATYPGRAVAASIRGLHRGHHAR